MVVGCFVLVAIAQAQEAEDTGSSPASDNASATNASNDPLTPKVTVQMQNFAMPLVQGRDSHGSDEELLRLYVPFEIGGVQNMFRVYAPIDSVPGTGVGSGDWTVFDVVLHKVDRFEFGAGPLAVLPVASTLIWGLENCKLAWPELRWLNGAGG